ncbi:replication protein [Bacillus toyonensis]|uniref:replication protein n=1 Tax=Bacillus toyonensis TaxID=155322 RepID=UPI000BEE624B|nr:replication protein [Bacillus toyonensis]PEB19692.1 replication protein [Bacillus toyonensis]
MSSNIFQLETFARSGYMVRLAYVDITEDLIAGILLGQIVYWYMPNEQGKSKLRVKKNGEFWLAKSREDWRNEIRITPKQYDRAIKILIEKGFVEVQKFKFNGAPTNHIKLNISEVTQRVKSILTFGENPNPPLGEMEITERVNSLTEITTKTTTEITTKEKPSRHKFETCDINGAKYLFEKIRGNNPKQKEPNLDSWSNDFRLMREKDNRELQEIKDVIDWCQADPFWQGNILSAKKLREKFDQLTIQMKSKKGAKNNAESGGSNTNRYSQKGEYDYGF